MAFNSWVHTPFQNPLMMRLIVSVHLSVAHSEDRSWGKWCTTIRTMSVVSGASLTLIELTDWLSAVPGPCPVPGTRQAQLFKSSEMAGAFRVSSRCNPDSLSASWTAQPVRYLVPQPCSAQEAWLQVRYSGMPVGAAASAAESTNSSTRKHLFMRRLFQLVALLMANTRFPAAGRYSATSEEISSAGLINASETAL